MVGNGLNFEGTLIQDVKPALVVLANAVEVSDNHTSPNGSARTVIKVSTNRATERQTRWLDLPTEVREQIIRYLLIHNDSIDLTIPNNMSIRRGKTPAHLWQFSTGLQGRALLRLDRRTHKEATDVLYGNNVFFSQVATSLLKLPQVVTPRSTAMIRRF